jgi:exonuclease VII large subunit
VGSLPEDGRNNWLNDKIAAEAGQHAVSRYNPQQQVQKLATDQQAEALQWVAAMKVGVPPVVTSSQNAVTYASTFLAAGVQAVQSVQQGGDPLDVLKFMGLCGPAIHAHLERFKNDPTRQTAYEAMQQQWEQLARVTDQLKQHMNQQMQKQNKQQVKTQQAMSDEQIKTLQARGDIARKNAKTRSQIQISQAKAKQGMAIADATTAAEIHRNRLKAFSE